MSRGLAAKLLAMSTLTIPEVTSKVINYRITKVYGNDQMYVASEHAQSIATLTGKKTIDASDMLALEALGFSFNRVF
jgi:hypothetical protein